MRLAFVAAISFAVEKSVTLTTLCERFVSAPAGESIMQAAARAADFVEAALPEFTEAVTESLRRPKLLAADGIGDLGAALTAFRSASTRVPHETQRIIALAEERLSASLPSAVRELWEFLGEASRARWVRGVLTHTLIDPRQLVTPPLWASDARLCCVADEDSASDTRERFADDYEEWFAEADSRQRVTDHADLAARQPGALVMLDPKLRDSLISVAYWHDTDWFVVYDLRGDGAESPVFSNHDDDGGLSEYIARDVRAWFSLEVSQAIRAVAEQE